MVVHTLPRGTWIRHYPPPGWIWASFFFFHSTHYKDNCNRRDWLRLLPQSFLPLAMTAIKQSRVLWKSWKAPSVVCQPVRLERGQVTSSSAHTSACWLWLSLLVEGSREHFPESFCRASCRDCCWVSGQRNKIWTYSVSRCPRHIVIINKQPIFPSIV